MKRDWDTIREILVKVESCTLPTDNVSLSDFEDFRAAEISYHVGLLIEAGLINGQMYSSLGPSIKDFYAKRLTWSGHEFLDSIRKNNIWEKTKDYFAQKGIEMSFEAVKSVALKITGAIIAGAP